jgi:hypothetical protein
MGLLLKKGLKIIPQDISSSLAATLGKASENPPWDGSEEKLWKALEEGSWEEVEALLLKALSPGKNPRDQRGLGNLSIYLSRKLAR